MTRTYRKDHSKIVLLLNIMSRLSLLQSVGVRRRPLQSQQLRGPAECLPQRVHSPRHQPGQEEGEAVRDKKK